MINTVKCPKCGEEVEISKAIFDEQLAMAKKEAGEESQKRIRQLSAEMAELIKANQNLKRLEEERELETAKKIAAVEDKVRQDALKKTAEETSLKLSEKDKKIADMEKMIENLKRTAQQGSQQTQGEVLELQLEQLLKTEFPNDIIKEVPKGIRGADIIQEVYDKSGRFCGTILWESKNARWSPGWIQKLKDDLRAVKGDIAVLLSVDLPKEFAPFKFQAGIWVTNRDSMLSLAFAIRKNLYEVFVTKMSNVDKGEKMVVLYEYVNSQEFRQKIEAMAEAFSTMHEEIEREKRWFAVRWARQEKIVRKALDSTYQLYGNIQGITGTLPELKLLEVADEGDDPPTSSM